MNIEDFLALHDEKAKTMDVFEVLESDSKIIQKDIQFVERDIGCKLPKKYIDFCSLFGGGYFGFTIIHSMDRQSDWYIDTVFKKFKPYLPNDYIPFSDDQTGGLYCFRVIDNIASDKVFYIDSNGEVLNTEYADCLDYIADKAYSF
jgi:hypothetical protein